MSRVHLLDANALIALTLTDHEHHQRAATWAAGVDRVALCPITEGALVRFMIRLGQNQATAMALLGELHANPRCAFWPDSISYREAPLDHVMGHRQVTDAYLAALATRNGGLLATFDEGLAQVLPRPVALIP